MDISKKQKKATLRTLKYILFTMTEIIPIGSSMIQDIISTKIDESILSLDNQIPKITDVIPAYGYNDKIIEIVTNILCDTTISYEKFQERISSTELVNRIVDSWEEIDSYSEAVVLNAKMALQNYIDYLNEWAISDTQQLLIILNEINYRITQLERANANSILHSPVEISEFMDFKRKWNDNLFLNNYSNVKYKDQNLSFSSLYGSSSNYILPNAIYGYRTPKVKYHIEDNITASELSMLLTDYDKLGEGLIVIGLPGIGKSSLIVWLCNRPSQRTIRVFSIAKLIKDIADIDSEQLLKKMCLKKNDLRDSILILDGLDEVNLINQKETFINDLFNCLSGINNLSIVITCRENYLRTDELQPSYVKLVPWNHEQITKFLYLYHSKISVPNIESTREIMIKKPELFGIPLITYMVIASGIEIKNQDTEIDIYDSIFALKGGILDHQIEGRDIDHPRPINLVLKKEILDISQNMAFWMFENNPSEAEIPNAFSIFPELEERPILLDHFKKVHHTDGENNVCFIHRSMYEYFVACKFVELVEQILKNEKGNVSPNSYYKLAKLLASFFKIGKLVNRYEESLLIIFIRLKLKKLLNQYHIYDSEKNIKNFYAWWEISTFILIKDGSLPYVDYNDLSKLNTDTLTQEINCAYNAFLMLRVVYQLYNPENNPSKKKIFSFVRDDSNIYSSSKLSRFIKLLSYETEVNDYSFADMQGLNLSMAFFHSADFSYSLLNDSELSYSSFRMSNFCFCDMSKANLKYANLQNVILTNSDFSFADLRSSSLQSAQIKNSKFVYTDLRNASLDSANISYTDFSNADLRSTKIDNIELRNVNMKMVKKSDDTTPRKQKGRRK